jgi:hypothetical protein
MAGSPIDQISVSLARDRKIESDWVRKREREGRRDHRVKPERQQEAPGEEEARRVPRVHQRRRRPQDPLADPASQRAVPVMHGNRPGLCGRQRMAIPWRFLDMYSFVPITNKDSPE